MKRTIISRPSFDSGKFDLVEMVGGQYQVVANGVSEENARLFARAPAVAAAAQVLVDDAATANPDLTSVSLSRKDIDALSLALDGAS